MLNSWSWHLSALVALLVLGGCQKEKPAEMVDLGHGIVVEKDILEREIEEAKQASAQWLSFTDVDGTPVAAPKDGKTMALVATWCPGSRDYIKLVSALSNEKLVDSSEIVFVFTDERAHLKATALEALSKGEMTREKFESLSEAYSFDKPSDLPVFYDRDLLYELTSQAYVTSFPKGGGPQNLPALLTSASGETASTEALYASTQSKTSLSMEQFVRRLVEVVKGQESPMASAATEGSE